MIKIRIAQTLEEKLKGLMGLKNITKGLLIPYCNQIHTFNMEDNIDILFLDYNFKVIYKFVNVSKNNIIIINKNTHVLELPKYTSININLGTVLSFKNKDII